MLRPVPLNHYLDIMVAKGHCREALIAGTSVQPTCLSMPDYLISSDDFHRFISNLICLERDRGAGLELGMTLEPAHFGVLAYAGLSCNTIRQGIQEIWNRYGEAFGANSRISIVFEDEHAVTVQLRCPRSDDRVYRFFVEEALCVLQKIGGALTGRATIFDALAFDYPPPPYADRYADIFRCPVAFDAVSTRATVRRSWIDMELKTTDGELNRACRERLEWVLKQSRVECPVALRVRQLLLSHIAELPSAEAIAREFGMSSRSFVRRLQREGQTYQQVVKGLRCELAQEWLRTTAFSAKEIGFRLGFRDTTAFRRAFKEWTGLTMSEYRADLHCDRTITHDAHVTSGCI